MTDFACLDWPGAACSITSGHVSAHSRQGSSRGRSRRSPRRRSRRCPRAPRMRRRLQRRRRAPWGLLPIPTTPIRFRDVGADAQSFEIDQRIGAVIALVANFCRPSPSAAPSQFVRRPQSTSLDWSSYFPASCTVTPMTAPVSSTACSAWCARCVRPSFILVILASGSRPVVVRAILLSLTIEARQVRSCRRLDARGLVQLGQEVVLALARVAPADASQGGIRFQRRRVNADRFPLTNPRPRVVAGST